MIPVTWLVPIVTAASMGRTRYPLQAGCVTASFPARTGLEHPYLYVLGSRL